MVQYRFPDWKGKKWNTRASHEERYEKIKPYLGSDSIGAEIGVYQGGFGELLLPHCKLLYLVDPWLKNDVEYYHSVRSVYENDANVVISRERSDQFIPKLDDNSMDFFYIDGCHKFQSVLKDASQGFRKLKHGGYLTGDDFQKNDVRLALTHFVVAHNLELISLPPNQWAIHKPETHEI